MSDEPRVIIARYLRARYTIESTSLSAADDILALLREAGLAIVPRDPTYPMLAAGRDTDAANEKETARHIEEENRLTWRTENVGKVWAAMVAVC
jgi:hypothetical protein